MPRRGQAHPYLQSQAQINKALVDGIGGMQFVAQAPPGVGRLIRIPFYLETAVVNFCPLATGVGNTGNVTAALGAVAAAAISTTVPVICAGPPAAVGAGATAILRTPQISWATLRIVGFEVDVLEALVPATSPMQLSVSDLKIGGGANLFVHEDFAPTSIYLAGQPSFAGLRDYPLLVSPNTSEVSVQTVGLVASDRVNFSTSLVCSILTDDQYGSHIPGPASRPGAMVRQGGSFVSG